MNHHSQERPSCRGCRILRAELVRCQRESEAQATQDAQRCLAMYDHMERLVRLNMALTQSRSQSHQMSSQPMEKRVVVDTLCHDKEPKRVQQLQETIGQQAREIERLQRTLKSSVPMLPWDGTIRAMSSEKDDSSEDDHGENSEPDDSADCIRRPRRGLEKLPLTSLHAQLRARDATIHRLEQHVAELTSAVDACREKKSRAIAQYQKLTKAQQSQLKKYTARIYEQQRTQRKGEREIEGLQAYVAVLEKKLLARRPEIRHGSS